MDLHSYTLSRGDLKQGDGGQQPASVLVAAQETLGARKANGGGPTEGAGNPLDQGELGLPSADLQHFLATHFPPQWRQTGANWHDSAEDAVFANEGTYIENVLAALNGIVESNCDHATIAAVFTVEAPEGDMKAWFKELAAYLSILR